MKILFAVDEAYPLFKIGGLGDVGGSLPIALTKLQIDVRIALPKHPEIDTKNLDLHLLDSFDITYKRQPLPVKVWSTYLPGSLVPVYLFQEARYISEKTDAGDNHADKFTVFSLAVATWLNLPERSWLPQLVHLQDWHTAMIPVILKHHFHDTRFKHVITIHNLAFQGNTNTPILRNLDLPQAECRILTWDGLDNHINILLEGILHADATTTVSPTYAHEILTSEYGEHLEDVLNTKKHHIIGILNGLDYNTFNPETDPYIYHQYNDTNALEVKNINKKALLKDLKLDLEIPELIGFVGRVDPAQKGIALIIEALEQKGLTNDHTQFIFLGTGDPLLEQRLHQAAANDPKCCIVAKFDEPLARKVYAAADLIVIPSKYEPCGLVQMIAMRYGTIPVARKTGGLADTIHHDGNGFLFDHFTTADLVQAIAKAQQTMNTPDKRAHMIKEAMNTNFTWIEPAKHYQELFEQILLDEDFNP